MQSVKEFMNRFFQERIAQEEREQASRIPFLREFYTEGFHWIRHGGRLEMFRSERISSISSSDKVAEVITHRDNLGNEAERHDMRYHLQKSGDGWVICGVDLRCCSCSGEPGEDNCPCCHGTGWRSISKAPAESPAKANCAHDRTT